MKEEIKTNLKNTNTWLRLLFMVLFSAFYFLAISVFGAMLAFQILVALLTGNPNERVRQFHAQLVKYIYQVLRYVSFGTEEKPFPFSDWPDETPEEISTPVPVPDTDQGE